MNRLRPSNLTIRARLTLVHGGLFLLAGVLLLAVTYALMLQQLPPPPPVSDTGGTLVLKPSDGLKFPAGQTLITRDSALNTLLTQGGIALVVVALAATAFGWLIAGRLLQPLQRVTETAQRIAEAPDADRGLHERIALDGPRDEVKRLADTFDHMLERLDHSFDGQRRFIANASHELRTPLTLNRTLLEVALDPEAMTPPLRHVRTTLLAVNARHERLIDGLLLLARSEGEVLKRSYVDLADIVEHVTTQVPPGPVTVHSQPREAPTVGNPVLLERLVQNLVENGMRHNVPVHGWVGVMTDTHPDGTAVLRVSNTGPVVPRYEIPDLFEPFHRLDTDRATAASGAGLGLSIVQAIARAHGGGVHAEPRDGGGLHVTVTLPGADPATEPHRPVAAAPRQANRDVGLGAV